jgi:hypothetical protein
MRFSTSFAFLVFLLSGWTVTTAAPGALGPGDRDVLADYARDTWRSIAAMAERGPLPVDGLRRTEAGWVAEGLTSPTNIAAYLWSTLAAEDLGLIARDEAGRRVGQCLTTLARLERSHGFFFNWYDPSTGLRARTWPGGGDLRPFLSVVDNGWLAAALILVENTRPEFRESAEALLTPMDFGFFYDPFNPSPPNEHPGLLRGGYWPDDGTFAGFYYGALNTEPRIASYVGIARGNLPTEHYYRMFRSRPSPPQGPSPEWATYAGVPVDEGCLNYRGIAVVPTWDGTMFEALMVPLLVPEAEWAPRSWGVNHPLYVRAQIEYGLHDARLGFWGRSAASTPGGGYGAYGVAALGVRTQNEVSTRPSEAVIAPYASFLALPFAPLEALANLRALAEDFPVYGPYGFLDSVDVNSGRVSDRVLILDQAMILAALDQVIGRDALRRGFCNGAVEAAVRPLIALERFDATMDPTTLVDKDDLGNRLPEGVVASRSRDRFASIGLSRLRRPNLVGGIITVAGLSAVIARRARVTRKSRPTPSGGPP